MRECRGNFSFTWNKNVRSPGRFFSTCQVLPEHGLISLVRGNKRGFGCRIYFFPSSYAPARETQRDEQIDDLTYLTAIIYSPWATLNGRLNLKEERYELKILILRQKNNVQDTSEWRIFFFIPTPMALALSVQRVRPYWFAPQIFLPLARGAWINPPCKGE